jgi:RNA polymerase sigma-70 factor (ECF subfamily)
LPKFRGTAKFSTWLYRIAWNVASDQRQAIAQGRTQLRTLTEKTPTQQDAPDLMDLHYQDLVQRGLWEQSSHAYSMPVLPCVNFFSNREYSYDSVSS